MCKRLTKLCKLCKACKTKFCRLRLANQRFARSFAAFGLQTPYKASLCMACKRLTKLRFVWREVLPPPARSFAASGEKFCRHTKLCFVRLANACGEKFCTKFLDTKLCYAFVRRLSLNFTFIKVNSVVIKMIWL